MCYASEQIGELKTMSNKDKAKELFEIAIDAMIVTGRAIEINGVRGSREYEHSAYMIRRDGTRFSIWAYYVPMFSYVLDI
jgi:hypothetical protein